MKKSVAGLVVVAAIPASILLPAAAAGAASLTVADATGDTWTTDYSNMTATDVSAGSQVNVDLTKTVIRYANGTVTVTASYVDLTKSTNRFMFGVRLRTNEGLKRVANVETVTHQTWSGAHHIGTTNGDELHCRGLAHDIDYQANTVTLVVPASCLSKPRWVQAAVGTDGFAVDVQQPFMSHDNGLNDSWKHGGWTSRIRKG